MENPNPNRRKPRSKTTKNKVLIPLSTIAVEPTETQKLLRVMPLENFVVFPGSILPIPSAPQWMQDLLKKQRKEDAPLTFGVVGLFPADLLEDVSGSALAKEIDDPTGELAQQASESGEGIEYESLASLLSLEQASHLDDQLFQKLNGTLLCSIGTEVKVIKTIHYPDHTVGIMVQGVRRFRLKRFMTIPKPDQLQEGILAEVDFLPIQTLDTKDLETVAIGRAIKQLIHKAVSLLPQLPSEVGVFLEMMTDISHLVDVILPYLSLDFTLKQMLLSTQNPEARIRRVQQLLAREVEILELSHKINNESRNEINKQQKRYILKEQLRALQKEIFEIDGGKSSPDVPQFHPEGGQAQTSTNSEDNWQDKINNCKMPTEVLQAAQKEAGRLQMMHPSSPEYSIAHTYLTWLCDMPWDVYSQNESICLKKAAEQLDLDHHGLDKVKKRIMEFLAVYTIRKNLKGPILLFVGPPGVGKTSLGESIAKVLGRKFQRIALGGVHDESEIRGHRRTYVGSLPGKIVNAIKKSGTFDPVILLDEIDKLSFDGRGDPASALLEVLDPEQNKSFMDHYLNVPIDLSRVFFIATANQLGSIPAALYDRLEVIELSSYTLYEKERIAFNYLLPQILKEHGVETKISLALNSDLMRYLVQGYTREAGVRQLKRELASLLRSLILKYSQQNSPLLEDTESLSPQSVSISKNDLKTHLGAVRFLEKIRPQVLPVGVATGLAWTPMGGDVLYIETAASAPGTGKFGLTGQLGDVMKESIHTAFAYIRSHPVECGVQVKDINKKDLHIHFPEGAVKKDGPSAGIAAFLGIVSQFSGRALAADVAMTGEISLRGDVLPVGGIKEKLLAAHRNGIKHILIPQDNTKDLEEIPPEILSEIEIHSVSNLQEVLALAFKKKRTTGKNAGSTAKSRGAYHLNSRTRR